MDDLWGIFASWQFLVAGIAVFIVVAFFNGLGGWKGIGYYLWGTKNTGVRKFLKLMEAVKMPFMFLLGFGYGAIPGVPRPEALDDVSWHTIALIYGVAGLFSVVIVKWGKKFAEARGIDIELDMSPKEQKKAKFG